MNNFLSFALHGETAQLESNQPAFLKFAAQFLADSLFPADSSPVGLPGVVSRLHWDAVPAESWQAKGARRWGRRLIQLGTHWLQTEVPYLPGLQLEAYWEGTQLYLDGYYRLSSRLKRALLGWNPTARQAVWAALLYPLVYFPLILRLEALQGYRLLHASAVELGTGACLLLGLPGSGKSTLSLALLGHPQAALVADNLLLTDGKQVFAVPETIHLGETGRELLPQSVRDRLSETGFISSHQRSNHRLGDTFRTQTTRPTALFFLSLGDKADIQPLEPGVAIRRIEAFDTLAREMNAYAAFRAALEPLVPVDSRSRDALFTLMNALDCWEVTLYQGEALEPIVEWITKHSARAQTVAVDGYGLHSA